MGKKWVRVIVLGMLVALFMTSTSLQAYAKDKVYTLRIQSMFPKGTPFYHANEVVFERLSRMSNGRLKFMLFPAGSIVGSYELPGAIGKGTLDGGTTAGAYLAGKDLGYMFFTYIPGGGGITEEQGRAWWLFGGGLELARKAYAKLNLYYVAPQFGTPEVLISRVPIRTIEDFKGKRARFTGLAASIAKELGISVTDIPTEEQYTALETGLLDIVDPVGPPLIIYAQGMYEVAPFLITPGWHQVNTAVDFVFNLEKWKTLPPDLQLMIERESLCGALEGLFNTQMLNNAAMNKMVKKGVTVIRLPDEDVAKISQIAQKYINQLSTKSPLAAEIWKSMCDYVKKFE